LDTIWTLNIDRMISNHLKSIT